MARVLKSALSGVWLIQTIKMTAPVPCKIDYSVRHKGDGNHKLRVRFGNYWLSRGALSKAIDWELTYSVTRLEGETDATNECDVTVTNEG